MSAVPWERVKAALTEVLAVPREARIARLREVCAGDAELEEEVRALLGSEQGGRMLDRLSVDLWTLPDEAPDRAGRVGEIVDGHRLVRLLGAGGMAEVYEAEVTVEGRVRRVALKLLREGSVSAFAGRRFAVEARGLERLDHPGIARFHASGFAANGTPYIAMELVAGEPLDEHCDRRRLSLRARARLLARVCDAVTHAHAAGVVHRDIKPSNVLVRDDGSPVLLDFGIAKLLDEGGSGAPGTVTRQSVALTPLYVSPEQVEGDAVSPATDVFALGAVGYRLAVGAPPPDLWRRKPRAASELLAHEDADTARDVAALRGVTLPELLRSLRSGLDRILRKACTRKPQRRHRSAAELGERLGRWAERPGRARRPRGT